MKLVQLNIWGGKLTYQILDFVAEHKPDILCMQEVHDLPGRSTNNMFAPLSAIKKAGKFSDAFMSPTGEINYMNRQAGYGNAILLRETPAFTDTIFTNGKFKANYDPDVDDDNVRNVQHVRLGNGLNVLNHHGFYVAGSKDGSPETERQMRLIADYVSRLDGPVILAGDFNLAPHTPSIRLLSESLRNLSVEFDLQSTYTDLSIQADVCDYIFLNQAVKLTGFTVPDVVISDHKPLILEFDL